MTKKWPKKKDRPGVDRYGRTHIHNAVNENDIAKLAELIAAGKDINAQDDNGWTALHFAAQDRNIEMIKLLLKHGADPNLIDIYGNGPLWTATMNAGGSFECVAALLEHNALPDPKNKAGRSPLDMANAIGHGLEEIFRKFAQQNT